MLWDCAASVMTEVCENRLDRRLSGGGNEIVSGEPVRPSFLEVFVTKVIFLRTTNFNHRSIQGQPFVELRVSFPAHKRALQLPVTSFTSNSRARPICHAAGQRSAPAAPVFACAHSSGPNPLGSSPTTSLIWTRSFGGVNAHTVHVPRGSLHKDINSRILTPFLDKQFTQYN